MSKFLRWFLVGATVVLLSACGGGSSDINSTQTSTITGYAEDDPLANASIVVTDEQGTKVVETKADTNGKYILEAVFKNGETYTLESKGKIGEKDITLHSIFVFSSDTVINANPITELKYQLVQSGKTIEDAETLIRDYFSMVSGEKLERNRFDVDSTLAVGMADLAKLYDGLLPVDAIEKIKEDILRNESLDIKDYSYRTLLLNKITLEASASSLKLGEEVTVKVIGLTELNENYELKWSGIPEDMREDNNSKIFTITDNAQDVYVRASLYKKDDNRSIFISSADVTINFYKELTENNVTVADASIENNLTIGENSITIPAGTVTDGKVIRVQELQTGSDSTVAQFAIDAGDGVEGNITFNYKYNPYLVAEPRNLQISLRSGDEVKVLNVIDIDYTEHIVRFGIPLESSILRSANEHLTRVIIDLIKKEPSADQIGSLYVRYMTYIEKIIQDYGNDSEKSQYILNRLKGNLGKEKFTLLMKRKNLDNEYYYDILATAINYMIAKDSAELMFNSITTWAEAKQAFYDVKNGNCALGNQYDGLPGACTSKEALYIKKLEEADKVISAWVGNAKLTPGQTSFIKIAKIIANQSLVIKDIKGYLDTGKTMSNIEKVQFFTGITATEATEVLGIAGSPYTPNELQGYYINALIDSSASIISGALKFNFQAYAIGFGVNRAFDVLETALINGNRNATFPLVLALSKDYTKLAYSNTEKTKANGFSKEEFLNFAFPSNVSGMELTYRNQILNAQDYHLNSETIGESRLGSELDPNKRFEKAFLRMDDFFSLPISNSYDGPLIGPDSIDQPTSNPLEIYHNDYDLLNENERAFVYTGFRYMFGDSEAKKQFDYLQKGSIMLAQSILFAINEISDEDVTDDLTPLTGPDSLDGSHDIRVKSTLTISVYQEFKDALFNILHAVNDSSFEISNIKNFSSFEILQDNLKLKLTNNGLQTLNIKKIKMETYGVGLEYSEADNAWTLDRSVKEQHTYEATGNINDKFTYDSDLEKNVLSFATLFEGEGFSLFDNKLVGFKVTLVVEKAGVEKVVSKDFIFTTLADTEHLVQTDFTGATLKSSVKDALTDNPIANAQVTLVPSGLTDFTDAEGNYEVSGLAAGNYTIVISKEGYKQVEAMLTLVEDETKVYEVSLAIDDEHATTIGGVNITLKDALNGNVVTNGYVKVREGQNNKTGEVVQEIVNSDGNQSVNISLYPNTYTVEVGANGYSHSFNTVTILGDVNGTYEFSIAPVLEADQVRAVLTWGATPSDLDSHLVKKTNGNEDYHVYFGNSRPANADANLDTDDTSSYGPETITINNVNHASVYTYYVHNFSGGAESVLPNSGAKLEVYFGDQSRTFYVPNEEGQYWKVFEIENGRIIPCTSGCVFGSENGIVRSIDHDAQLFQNLPAK